MVFRNKVTCKFNNKKNFLEIFGETKNIEIILNIEGQHEPSIKIGSIVCILVPCKSSEKLPSLLTMKRKIFGTVTSAFCIKFNL